MFLRTSGNKADTSFPSVIEAIVFCIASFLHNQYKSVMKVSTVHKHIVILIHFVARMSPLIRVSQSVFT